MARKKVASEPVLRDWTAVDTALRDLKECQYALTELGVELDRRIDGLKDDYNKNAQPLQNRIKRLEGDVKEYVDAHRAELDGKSRTLVFGKVGYRAEGSGPQGADQDHGNTGPRSAEEGAARAAGKHRGIYPYAG